MSSLLSATHDRVFKEIQVKDLATFIAYHNKSIKIVFEDRTIVKMMVNNSIIKILNKYGIEITLNMDKPNQQQYQEYQKYIQVSIEFLEWVYLSKEEKQVREEQEIQQQ